MSIPYIIKTVFNLDETVFQKIETITHVAVDSRKVQTGTLFFALHGANTDGHLFIDSAIQKGAVAVVVQHDYLRNEFPENIHIFRVADTLQALQQCAQKKIEVLSPKIIAITGSVGKTTTKEFTSTLLSQEKKIFTPFGNMNSQIGLSLSVINDAKGDEEWYVLEMGMTHKGDISRLVEIAPPDIAIVTSVHYVHSQNFVQGLEDIAKAKSEIFSSDKTYMCIVNKDMNTYDTVCAFARGVVQTYSLQWPERASFGLTRARQKQCIFYEHGQKVHTCIDPCFIADHIYDNLIAAISIARSIGVSWSSIVQGIAQLQLPKMRLEIEVKSNITFINDAYNASEPSMISALHVLQSTIPEAAMGKKIAILGQMKELGPFSKECHERVAIQAIETADAIFCLGEEAQHIQTVCAKRQKTCFWTDSFEELIQQLQKSVCQGDVVLLKGSQSNQLWRVLEYF